MIRLIVTDMDGCLLDPGGKLPPDFPEAFALMKEKHVLFAAASGRSADGLRIPFGSCADQMALITDNGARIFRGGSLMAEEGLETDDYLPLIEEMRSHSGLIPIACGREKTWIEQPDAVTEQASMEMLKYYPEWHACDFENIPEKVIKFALLYFDDIEKNIYPAFSRFDSDRIRVQVTAYVWIDIYPRSVSKGSAVRILQKKYGILPEETAVFGDYLNDLSMADHATFSYAPANAHPAVRERFTETIRPNSEYGVTGKIIELLRNT